MILAGGTKKRRFSLENSVILIHQPSGGAEGRASDIDITAKEILRLKDLYIDILTKHTRQDREKISKDVDRDFYMSPKLAKEYGIIDDIIG